MAVRKIGNIQMNEPNRMRYLQAMGIDAYVSRSQLPGALPTRRLALVARQAPASAVPQRQEAMAKSRPGQMPQVNIPERKQAEPKVQPAPAVRPVPASPAVRFRLAAIFCGGIAWVESLGERPLAKEQVQLIRGMARAVHGSADTPKVAQFDWPIHNNPQLDQGQEAASAALTAFLLRHVDEQKCRALVILGGDASDLFAGSELGGLSRIDTCSTVQMLEQPGHKRHAWADLQPLVLRA